MKSYFTKKPATTLAPTAEEEGSRLLSEIDSIKTALATADSERGRLDTSLQAARAAYGESAADEALGLPADATAYQLVRDAQENLDRLSIRTAALNERLSSRTAELRTLADGPLQELRGRIANRYRAEWFERFREKAAALRACMAEGVALDQQLSLGISPPLVMAKLDDPESNGQNLLSLYAGFGFSKSATELHARVIEELRIVNQVKAVLAVREASVMPERTRPDPVPSVYTLSKVS